MILRNGLKLSYFFLQLFHLHFSIISSTDNEPSIFSVAPEKGYCVKTGGWDQNAGVIRLDDKDGDTIKRRQECLKQCASVSGVTGCELIFGQMHKGCFAHTQEVASGNGAGWHYCWILAKQTPKSSASKIGDSSKSSITKNKKDLNCTKEQGYCVSKNGWDQNAGVKRLDSLNEESTEREETCLKSCQSVQGVTGCELVWGQMNSGCYAHTREVGLGNGAARHICWIMSKCQEVERSLTSKESATFIIDAVSTTSLIKLVDLETNAISKELPKSNPSKATIRTTTGRPVSKTTITIAKLTSSNLQTSVNSANPYSTSQKKKEIGLGTIHDDIPAAHPNLGDKFSLDYSIRPEKQNVGPDESKNNKTIKFCSVRTPFDDILPSLHANNLNHKDDVLRIDDGRVQLNVSETLCQVAVKSAKSKDEGRWDFAVSTTNDFWTRNHIIYKVFVNETETSSTTTGIADSRSTMTESSGKELTTSGKPNESTFERIKKILSDLMTKITTPKEAYEYLFDENASLIVDVGIGELDGKHQGREDIEALFMKLPDIEELSIANTTVYNHTEHPNGTYVVDLNLGSKLIDAKLMMNTKGNLIARGAVALDRNDSVISKSEGPRLSFTTSSNLKLASIDNTTVFTSTLKATSLEYEQTTGPLHISTKPSDTKMTQSITFSSTRNPMEKEDTEPPRCSHCVSFNTSSSQILTLNGKSDLVTPTTAMKMSTSEPTSTILGELSTEKRTTGKFSGILDPLTSARSTERKASSQMTNASTIDVTVVSNSLKSVTEPLKSFTTTSIKDPDSTTLTNSKSAMEKMTQSKENSNEKMGDLKATTRQRKSFEITSATTSNNMTGVDADTAPSLKTIVSTSSIVKQSSTKVADTERISSSIKSVESRKAFNGPIKNSRAKSTIIKTTSKFKPLDTQTTDIIANPTTDAQISTSSKRIATHSKNIIPNKIDAYSTETSVKKDNSSSLVVSTEKMNVSTALSPNLSTTTTSINSLTKPTSNSLSFLQTLSFFIFQSFYNVYHNIQNSGRLERKNDFLIKASKSAQKNVSSGSTTTLTPAATKTTSIAKTSNILSFLDSLSFFVSQAFYNIYRNILENSNSVVFSESNLSSRISSSVKTSTLSKTLSSTKETSSKSLAGSVSIEKIADTTKSISSKIPSSTKETLPSTASEDSVTTEKVALETEGKVFITTTVRSKTESTFDTNYASCTCKDLINSDGFGNCKGYRDPNRNYKFACYVNQPSNCTDLVASLTNPGEMSSTQPCYEKRQLLKTKTHDNTSCTCKDLVNIHGFGNCRDRKSVHQGNKAICYVNLPSDCNDLLDSIMIPGEKSSAEACQSQAVNENGNNQRGESQKEQIEKLIADVPGIVKIYAKVFSGSKWEEITFVILVILSIIM